MEFFSYKYKNRDDEYEDPRREFLIRALSMGFFAVGGPMALSGCATDALGHRPHKLPPNQSIYRIRGDVRINGATANRDTLIAPDASIETGSNSELVFVVGKDAFMMRENSHLKLTPFLAGGGGGGGVLDSLGSAIIGSLRIVSGRLLSTFGHRTQDESLSLHTPTATVGIRGTGVYAEGYHDRSYVCTCYGHTRISANSDPEVSRDVVTTHHNAPKYILRDAPADQLIEPAPVIHHTDMEILLITALVGRTPPFAVTGSGYGAPRKISY